MLSSRMSITSKVILFVCSFVARLFLIYFRSLAAWPRNEDNSGGSIVTIRSNFGQISLDCPTHFHPQVRQGGQCVWNYSQVNTRNQFSVVTLVNFWDEILFFTQRLSRQHENKKVQLKEASLTLNYWSHAKYFMDFLKIYFCVLLNFHCNIVTLANFKKYMT